VNRVTGDAPPIQTHGAAYSGVVPRYDIPNAAPAPLSLVQRFVNTVDLEHDVEWLAKPADLVRTLTGLGLAVGRASTADVREAHELREALRALLVANAGQSTPSAKALSVVNRVARAGELVAELTPEGSVSFTARRRGVRGALAAIAAVVYAGAAAGDFSRLKACRNCRWAFYDYSRSRRATWCSMQLCGNRLKTRRYRERRRRSVRSPSPRA
jgi:predicted RNA-binding Zn ribbon-like protein